MGQNVLIGVRGLNDEASTQRVIGSLKDMKGVEQVRKGDSSQLEVTYDASQLTVMDLIRKIREQGFLAGML